LQVAGCRLQVAGCRLQVAGLIPVIEAYLIEKVAVIAADG